MKKKLLIIILVIVLAGGGAAYYFLVYQGGEAEEKLYAYVPGDYFVTNVKDSGKLFKVTVVLMLNEEKLQEKLEDKEYIIRDSIIQKLRQLTEADIKSQDIQNKLRDEIKNKLNADLGIDNIVKVYFNDFVMQ